MKIKSIFFILCTIALMAACTTEPPPYTLKIRSIPVKCQLDRTYSIDPITDDCIRHSKNGDNTVKCTDKLRELIQFCKEYW